MSATTTDLDAMTDGFVTALLWTLAEPLDMGERGETGGLENREPTDRLRNLCRDLCAAFTSRAGAGDIETHALVFDDPDGGHPFEFIGHTFYLSASGSGVCFADRAWRDDDPMTVVCARLDVVAHDFPEVEWISVWELPDGTVDGRRSKMPYTWDKGRG